MKTRRSPFRPNSPITTGEDAVARPIFTVAPTISGNNSIGETLTSTTGTATGTGAINYARQWMLDGAAIGGATAATFVAAAIGSHTCRVTATDDNGTRQATSNVIAVFAEAGPFSGAFDTSFDVA
jgi:hypothetical protein